MSCLSKLRPMTCQLWHSAITKGQYLFVKNRPRRLNFRCRRRDVSAIMASSIDWDRLSNSKFAYLSTSGVLVWSALDLIQASRVRRLLFASCNTPWRSSRLSREKAEPDLRPLSAISFSLFSCEMHLSVLFLKKLSCHCPVISSDYHSERVACLNTSEVYDKPEGSIRGYEAEAEAEAEADLKPE